MTSGRLLAIPQPRVLPAWKRHPLRYCSIYQEDPCCNGNFHGVTEMQKKPKNARRDLPEPLPATCTVPQAGAHFFGVDTPGAYRLARRGIIPVLKTGT